MEEWMDTVELACHQPGNENGYYCCGGYIKNTNIQLDMSEWVVDWWLDGRGTRRG